MQRDIHFEPLESRTLLAGDGLNALYYDRTDFSGKTRERIDTSVNFNWKTAAPVDGFDKDTFSVRWTGLLQPRYTQTYTFTLEASDGVRFWVGGKLLIDKWTNQSPTEWTGTIALTANKLTDLRLEYYDNDGTARAKLSWFSKSQSRQIVPRACLYSYDQRFAVVGDIGTHGSKEADVAAQVQRWSPQFIATIGDNNNGGSHEFDSNVGRYYYKYIGNYQGSYGTGSSTNRFFPAMGNHDWDADVDSYTNYFTLAGNERYYDFVQGDLHFFVIDSDDREPDGVTSTSTQAKWLQQKLAASTSNVNIVLLHHSPFSSGDGVGPTTDLRWPFKAWGADVVFGGHAHNYERITRSDGMLYFVNGLGGDPNVESFGSSISGSQKRYDDDWGAMLIQSNSLATTYQFITRTGKMIDSFTQLI